MNAAVVRSFEHPPRYGSFELPAAPPGEVVVDVIAAGLHPRVRSGAAGTHYADPNTLPMIPGVDGVGQLPDGRRVYFVVHDSPLGSMAEQTLIDPRRCVPLPESADAILVAAAMNPAMSSWLALRLRAPLQPGARILILGASANAGQMAVLIAKRRGAGEVIGAARRVDAVHADTVVSITDLDALARAAAEVDVVIDYVWGEVAAQAMSAIVTARSDRPKALDWIQIGAIAGATMSLPSAALRSANLRILGSGQGSISLARIVGELPALVEELSSGHYQLDTRAVPLAEVEEVWTAPTPPGQRIVFMTRPA